MLAVPHSSIHPSTHSLTLTLPCTHPVTHQANSFIHIPTETLLLCVDGNGGLYKALRDGHILEHMKSRGVEYVQTYCVDNILVKLPDLHFIGFCMDRDVECGAQVVQKINPKEPIGVLGMVSGRYQVGKSCV